MRDITNELPFEIPKSWEWISLKQIAICDLGKTLDKAKNKGEFKPYLCSRNVYWNDIDLSITKQARFEKSELAKYRLYPGDLLICEGGDVGRAAVWNSTEEMYYQNALHRIRFYGGIIPSYFQLIFEYYKGNQTLNEYSKGMTIKHLVQSALNSIYFPLPPLDEQRRIVKRVAELLPYINDYDVAEQKLTVLNDSFPNALKKSILQAAVQGQLVKQDRADESASVLLNRIRAEKKKLGKEGKIKKDKHESLIIRRDNSHYENLNGIERCIDDEIPFGIPATWEWIRLSTIGNWGSGATPSRTHPEFYGGEIPWLKTGDLNDGCIESTPEFITEIALEKTSVRLNPIGSVLVAMYGATIGKLGILSIPATTNQACCSCFPLAGFYNKFLFYFLMSQKQAFIKRGEGGAQPNISKEKIVSTLMPVPPLAEQYHIVEKVEKLLSLIKYVQNI